MPKPPSGSYPVYFKKYIDLVAQNNINAAFAAQQNIINDYFISLPAKKHLNKYAKGKWTLKEVLQHLIDCERIFAYRALCTARKEKQNILPFEENDYAKNSKANGRKWVHLCDEFIAVRQSTQFLIESFNTEQLKALGKVNGNKINALALAFICVGHVYHHINIINERYLAE